MTNLPAWFANAAEIVAFARDIIFLLILLVALFIVFVLYRKVSTVLESVKRTARSTEEMVAMVTENVARPASRSSGVAFGVGKIFAFLFGLIRRNRD